MTYERHSLVTDIEPVLALIRAHLDDRDPENPRKMLKKLRIDINGTPVNVISLRLRTFATKGLVCAGCGLKACFFALERNHADAKVGGPFHLNLYGVRDEREVLFTQDHLHARSTGGANDLSNTRTMCCLCNKQKSIEETRLAQALHDKRPN